MLEAVWIGMAFSLGLLMRLFGLPPLVGYLAAGADQTYLTMSEAGVGLAKHVRQRIMPGGHIE